MNRQLAVFVIVCGALMTGLSRASTEETTKEETVDGSSSPNVCLPKVGCLQGIHMPGFQTEKFEAFLGIPFAKPPIGELRFANPIPVEPWNKTLDATQAKPDCIQKNYLLPTPIVTGEEDCLYLNVYRPIVSSRTPLPVMVYIFGGGFFAGSANPLIHGPEYFMDTREVILVTLAYRVGAMGFLSTGDNSSPGNFGLKDQSLALKWVQNYIQFFGGDQDCVTIFGQSAGGASVHMHMLSPLSEGLFKHAIVMSGNAGAPYNIPIKEPLLQARKQAELVKIEDANNLSTKDLIENLRKVDAQQLVNSGDGLKYWHVDPLTTFRPVIESKGPGAFLTSDPRELIESGNYNQVPWMTGTVPGEGAVRALSIVSNETLRNEFNSQFDYLLAKLMEFDVKSKKHLQEKVNRIVNFYLNGSHMITLENANRFTDMISDRAFMHPLYKTISRYTQYANLNANPVSLYKFNYRGPYSYSFLYTATLKNYGVVHCDDLIYLFKSPLLFPNGFERDSVDAKVVKTMVETFVHFAIFGQSKAWKPYEPCNHEPFDDTDSKLRDSFCDYQEFRNSPQDPKDFEILVTNQFDLDVIQFWDEILDTSAV